MKRITKPIVREIRVRTALSRSRLPDIDYAFNPYIGCWHSCIYCYARLYTRYREVSENWGDIIYVKVNIVERLREDVRRYKPGVVGVGTITDAYQPLETVYRLTARSLPVFFTNGFHVSIQTKNTLILRDLSLLIENRDKVDVGFTITTLSDNKARIIEPRAPPSTARAEALRRIAGEGIETWIFYGPIIPGFNDDPITIHSLIELAAETRSKLLLDTLHVKKFMLQVDHPLYRYISRVGRMDWKSFFNKIISMCREHGVTCIVGYAEPSPKKHGKKVTIEDFF